MFDPTYPPTNAEIESAPLRSQFNGLKALIDAIVTVTAAQVEAVDTLNPGEPATVAVQVVGNELRFTFGIPQGAVGAEGPEGPAGSSGSNGADGPPGPQGPQGPGITGASVFEVQTLPPGSQATASVMLNHEALSFSFSLPRGDVGEVTTPQMDAAIATAIQGTSPNSNAVGVLNQNALANYDQNQMQDVLLKLDELITALRRA